MSVTGSRNAHPGVAVAFEQEGFGRSGGLRRSGRGSRRHDNHLSGWRLDAFGFRVLVEVWGESVGADKPTTVAGAARMPGVTEPRSTGTSAETHWAIAHGGSEGDCASSLRPRGRGENNKPDQTDSDGYKALVHSFARYSPKSNGSQVVEAYFRFSLY
jgi:hypothetical protein